MLKPRKINRTRVRLTIAGYLPLCEQCEQPLDNRDVDKDGYTQPTDCCDRVALCHECRKKGQHECDK